MKMKICVALVLITLITGMCACSSKSPGRNAESAGSSVSEPTYQGKTDHSDQDKKPDPGTASDDTFNEETNHPDPLTAEQLNLSYFPYDVREKIIEKALSYTLTLNNKSPYPLLSTEIIYKTKETASDKALKQFNEFKTKHKKYIQQDEDNRNIILIGRSEAYVKPGKSVNDIPVTIGIHSMTWYDTPNYDQFVLMRPDTLSLGLVKDNVLYHCQYSFTDNTWTVEENTQKLNNWPSTELTALVPKPAASDYYRLKTGEKDDYLSFTAYGLSEADYNNYVQAVQDAGFVRKKDKRKRSYSAEDKKGNAIDILYDKTTWNMEVNVNL